MNEYAFTSSLLPREKDSQDRFWLSRIQLFNWGTFEGIHTFPVSKKGYIFAGPSGAGKSTALDAHAVLLTPPQKVGFNQAARTSKSNDRNIVSYMRGAYGSKSDESHNFTTQYLRPDSTWSAISETYCNELGKVVTIARVFSVRGTSCSINDIKRDYFVFEEDFTIDRFRDYAEAGFSKNHIKTHWPKAHHRDEFAPYREIFCNHLNIKNERALVLLHKTQSTKDLGDLGTFIRNFMLDEPRTFESAERLVDSFTDLSQAHAAVEVAEHQQQVLEPIRKAHEERKEKMAEHAIEKNLQNICDAYTEKQKQTLFKCEIDALEQKIKEAQQVAQAASRQREQAESRYDLLIQKRSGNGGALIEQFTREIQMLTQALKESEKRQAELGRIAQTMGWIHEASHENFISLQDQAQAWTDSSTERKTHTQTQRDEVVGSRNQLIKERQKITADIKAMRDFASNLPADLLNLRQRMARELDIDIKRLVFAGEVMQVKKTESAWQGAMERLLHSFSLSLLVNIHDAGAVRRWVNDQHLKGTRLVYLTIPDQVGASPTGQRPAANSVIYKLDFADNNQGAWVKQEVLSRFTHECCESAEDLAHVSRGLTQKGQIKSSANRYEKDDRKDVNDARHWVMGFGIEEKLALYIEREHEISQEITELDRKINDLDTQSRNEDNLRLMVSGILAARWEEFDVEGIRHSMNQANENLISVRETNPNLDDIERELEEATAQRTQARDHAMDTEAQRITLVKEQEKIQAEKNKLKFPLLTQEITPSDLEKLKTYFDQEAKGEVLTLQNIEAINTRVTKLISKHIEKLKEVVTSLEKIMTAGMTTFKTRWPAEAADLVQDVDSAEGYLERLEQLERDALPKFKDKFTRMLREQSGQHMTRLLNQLEEERTMIRNRIQQVNEALSATEYNPGTYLLLSSKGVNTADVNRFKEDLRQATQGSLSSSSANDEGRFAIIKAIVERLASDKPEDKNWRMHVLDVRQHIDFIAEEKNAQGDQVDSYKGASGKSGGQGQKLTLTILAAALRYQLSGDDGDYPVFSTVTIDEAFDKTDSEFTRMTMKIFESCGFQLVVATPLKAVITLDEFVGGACYIHMDQNKRSQRKLIEYDEDKQRLKLSDELRRAAGTEEDGTEDDVTKEDGSVTGEGV